jgi:ferritin-like metal-binding protein YciE
MTIDTLDKLFHEELKDLYDVEKRLTKALPKMMKATSSEELKQALEDHLNITAAQVGRLESVFEAIEAKPQSKPCLGIKGILEEGEEMMKEDMSEELMDIAIIGAARRVEHYEISGYLGLRDMAQALGMEEAAELIGANLQEEMDADEALSQLCATMLENAGGESDDVEEEDGEEADDETEDDDAVMEEEEDAEEGDQQEEAPAKKPAASKPAAKKAVKRSMARP